MPISGCTAHRQGNEMYRYTYTDDDLRELYAKCRGIEQVYVLFNNETMYEDAMRFTRLIEEQDYNRASPMSMKAKND